MNIFFWKNNRQIDRFAQALADELFSGLQPGDIDLYCSQGGAVSNDMKHGKAKPVRVNQNVERRIANLVLRVQQFHMEQQLGVYGKARLNLVFMERLRELGCKPSAVDKLSRTILLQSA